MKERITAEREFAELTSLSRFNKITDILNHVELNKEIEHKTKSGIKWFRDTKNVTHGNRITSLIDGKDAFKSMYDAMQTAKGSGHFIYSANWNMDLFFNLIPNNDKSSLHDILLDKAQSGVEIRIILSKDLLGNNEYTGYNITQKHRDFFKHKFFKNGQIGSCVEDDNLLPLGVHHQKILLIYGTQGLIGFCGGIEFVSNRLDEIDRWYGKSKIIVKTNSGSGSGSNAIIGSLHDVHCKIEKGLDMLHIIFSLCLLIVGKIILKDHPIFQI